MTSTHIYHRLIDRHDCVRNHRSGHRMKFATTDGSKLQLPEESISSSTERWQTIVNLSSAQSKPRSLDDCDMFAVY